MFVSIRQNHFHLLFLFICYLHLSVIATPCKKGFYKGIDNNCRPCPAGTYNDVLGAQGIDVCLPCPIGTFSRREAAISRSQCRPCAKGSSSPLGATRCKSCPPGTFISPHSNKCVKCSNMSIAPDANSLECIRCARDNNTVANKARTKCVKCLRGTGAEIYDGKCKKCRNGTFNDGTFSFCRACPPGTTTNGEGTGCKDCPSGTAKISFSGRCGKCPKGQNIGAIGSFECIKPGEECGSNMFRTPTGACKFCQPGERLNPKLKKCVKCRRNSASAGGLSTKCKRCDKGTVTSADGSRCVCPIGWTAYPDGSCRKCPAGRFVENHSTTQSDDAIDSTSCNECPDGTFSTGGADACEVCPDGFEPNRMKTDCQPCPAGLRSFVFSNDIFSTSRCVDPKTNCPPGEDRGFEFSSNGELAGCGPKKCPNNTERDLVLGQVKCVSCPIGSFYRRSEFSTSGLPGYCISCPKELGLPDRSGCSECPVQDLLTLPNQLGSICGCRSNQFGDSFLLNGSCVEYCPDGQEGIYAEPFRSDRCEKCAPGTAREMFDNSRCRVCLKGFFADRPGRKKCRACPDGETTISTGSTSCVSL